MDRNFDLPSYNGDVPGFAKALRERLAWSPDEVAIHMHLDRSRIAKYETPGPSDRPSKAYLGGLARLIAEEVGDDAVLQNQLLEQVNRAVSAVRRKRFQSWAELCAAEETQRAKNRERRAKQGIALSADVPETLVGLPSYVPPERSGRRFGSARHMVQIQNWLTKSNRHPLLAVEGAGGSGKTTLVLKVLHTLRWTDHFQATAWIGAQQQNFLPRQRRLVDTGVPRLTVDGLVDELANQLQVELATGLDADAKRRELTRQLQAASRPTLIVVDNLETAADVDALLPYLQEIAQENKVIVTSRHGLNSLPDEARVKLTSLSRGDAQELLRTALADLGIAHWIPSYGRLFDQLYAIVGGNPLALKVAAGYLCAVEPDDVVALITELENADIDDFYAFLFRHSWQALDEPSRQLLGVMPLVQRASKAQLAAIDGLERGQRLSALTNLERVSLIQVNGQNGEWRYSLHPLTESFLLNQTIGWRQVDADGLRGRFPTAIQANIRYWRHWTERRQQDTTKLDEEWSPIVKAIRFGTEEKGAWAETYELIEAFSPHMERRGHWDEWSKVLSRAIEIGRQRQEHAVTARLAALHARLLKRQGRQREAVIQFRRAIRNSRRAQDPFNEARACSNLGYHFIDMGYWDRAEVLCCHALEIFEGLDSNHGRAHTLNHLGMLYTRMEHWNKAEQYLQAAYNVWERTDDQHGMTLALLNFTLLHNESGAYDELLVYSDRALRQVESTQDQLTKARILANRSLSFHYTGDLVQAERENREAHAIFDELQDLQGIATTSENLALLKIDRGELTEAECLLRQALDHWRVLGSLYAQARTMTYLIQHGLACKDRGKTNHWLDCAERILDEAGRARWRIPSQHRVDELRRSASGEKARRAAAA